MFKIKNTDLYQHLLEICAEEKKTGKVPDKKKMWKALFSSEREPKRKDGRIPNLAGRLNRVEIRPDGICFIDSGGSCGGGYKDNSFMIMENK